MRIASMQNCTENGEILSCFLRIGGVESMTDCENRCRMKNRFAFELNDFYNFADRLNQSNFLYTNASQDEEFSNFQNSKLTME